jgi:CheY-like chemotaxis protein
MWLVEDHPFSFLSGISLLWNLPAFAGLLPTTGDDRATDFAVAALLMSMATVVIWLTVQIGKGLQQRKLFLFMGILYGICGAARIVSELGYSSAWPAWLVAPMHIFVPAALVVLSIFMFSSIPTLIKVLRASDEVRSLRGQAKLQAMPEGGSLRISTRNSPTLPELTSDSEDSRGFAGWLVLEVKDSGFGMDEETRAHIFEPFFTTKPEGKGTGLGLPTVYGIIRQFGAHIFVESQPGEGTQFQIYFPVRNPVVQLQRGAPVASLRQGEALTILLADDEPSLRAAIAEYLRGAGHRVLDSQSAHDALELARRHSGPIDVLLTDVVMPRLRGTELAHQVGQFHPGIHVMFISGYAQSLPEAQLPRGAVFLQKPFRLASLGEQLKLVPRKV